MNAFSGAAATTNDDLFTTLRRGFAAVAAQACHVTINYDRLHAFAATLPAQMPENTLDDTHHFSGRTPEETVAYILALDTINFGSGYKHKLIAEGWPLVSGSLYFTVATRLKEYFESNGAFTADQMAALDDDKVAALLRLDAAKTSSRIFAGLCRQALNETGCLIRDKFGGRFMTLIDSVQGSAEALVLALAQMDNFRDTHKYHGREIGFYKRAQIAASDLDLAFRRHGRVLFPDIDRLTMFADNALPHVLHTEGVLTYTPDLTARIRASADIAPGSDEEIELRACAAHAVGFMAVLKNMVERDLDIILWHLSAENPRYRQTPPHRAPGIFY